MCRLSSQGPEPLPPLPQPLLRKNHAQALDNRRRFQSAGVRVLNLLSAPGSGKTALVEAMALAWGRELRMAALVGDQATDRDARRLRACGLNAIAISTGRLCHLEAAQVADAIEQLPLGDLDLLLIENVGNLVCPAAYDLGEELRLVILAVGEGEDKPLKYPEIFQSADGVVINKLDLLEATGDDLAQTQEHIARVAPSAWTVALSARTGANLEALAEALHLPVRR